MADKSTRKKTTKHHNGVAAAAPPPAYFLSFTVKNYRCFGSEQTLNLSEGSGGPAPWTVILGDNGVGKTTLLQCLAILQPDWKRAGQKPLLLPRFQNSLSLYDSVMGNRNEFWCEICFGSRIKEKRILINKVDSFGVSQYFPDAMGVTVIESTPDISGLICYGYGASRRSGSTSLSEAAETDICATLFDDEATLINAEEWLLQADYAASRKSSTQVKARVRRDQIKDVLINLLPDVTDIRISQAKTGFSSFVEVETPYGWVPIQGLSLGYRSLISWMVDFASRLFDRYPDSENPLAEPAVCLVDEIDLHLHPRWQRTLMSFLSKRFPNTQFIATAHSPLVVQAAQNANIVVLRREGDHVVIDNDVEAIKNWRIDQVLTSDLFGLDSARPPQLDDAMKERQRILSKSRLSKTDRARLAELETQIGELPTGETPEDIDSMDIIRRAAKILQNGKDSST